MTRHSFRFVYAVNGGTIDITGGTIQDQLQGRGIPIISNTLSSYTRQLQLN